MDQRLRAVCDSMVPAVRNEAGRREYDAVVPFMSHDAVAQRLAALGGPARDDGVSESHLAAFEAGLRTVYGDLAWHRRSPGPLISALDTAVYDLREQDAGERAEARRGHLAAWPEAITAALPTLDAVSAATARALRGPASGLAAGLEAHREEPEVAEPARTALDWLVAHLDRAAATSEAPVALGRDGLAAFMGAGEGVDVDLGALEERVDAEADRLRELLADGCAGIDAGRSVAGVVADLSADHPSADGLLAEARVWTDDALAFTRADGLLDGVDGECRVAASPPTMRWATASLVWAGPDEPDGPSWYLVTLPGADWPAQRQREWLATFSRATLPVTTVHEVAPGHFAHGRLLRCVDGDVARVLHSPAFAEGWAHYGEELLLERGYRAHDPRFQVGVALKALMRVARLAGALGLHGGTLSVEEVAARFERDALMAPAVARAEADRATHDPTYGRYTWGKLAIVDARDAARRAWGAGFSLRRFHHALLDHGAPPLGLLPRLVEAGGSLASSQEG